MVSSPLVHAIRRRPTGERDPEKFKDLVKAIRLIFDEAVEARLGRAYPATSAQPARRLAGRNGSPTVAEGGVIAPWAADSFRPRSLS